LLKKSLDFRLPNSHDRAFAHSHSGCETFWLPNQTALAKKLIYAEERNHGFLALLGDDRNFDFALFDIEHCVCRIALRKDDFVLAVGRNTPALRRKLKEYRRIEPQLNRLRGRGSSPSHLDLPAFCATLADSLRPSHERAKMRRYKLDARHHFWMGSLHSNPVAAN
jgi:hypothetical protein